ncbi:MAG: 3-dehydroquinate synthase family protein, partial [Candidatus Kapabacteria bacterium]|nr:3-dehydroquinate synthase family protein [Candidatus Kapabacteria bacterium]
MNDNIIYNDESMIIEFVDYQQILSYLESEKNIFIILDSNVEQLYFKDLLGTFNTHVVNSHESEKTLKSYRQIIDKLILCGTDTDTRIISIGGGIVSDIAGYVAATYKRGLKLTLIPTTLLAMCDAAIGGKNGLNHNHIKNLVGTVYFPDRIFINPSFINSLSDTQIVEGIAEVFKISLVYNDKLREILSGTDISSIDFDKLRVIIKESIQAKMKIVVEDPNDKGLRRILNFGHTFAHAIESVYGLSHGKAVAFGIKIASFISMRYELIDNVSYDEIIN